MSMALQIEAVHQRALLMRQRALESPIRQDLLEDSLKELAFVLFVLEELRASEEELHLQNQTLKCLQIHTLPRGDHPNSHCHRTSLTPQD